METLPYPEDDLAIPMPRMSCSDFPAIVKTTQAFRLPRCIFRPWVFRGREGRLLGYARLFGDWDYVGFGPGFGDGV